MKKPRFQFYVNKKKEHCWRLRASNGEILASGEGFTRKVDAKRGVQAVKESVRIILTAEGQLGDGQSASELDA